MKKSLLILYDEDGLPFGVYENARECSDILGVPRGTINSWVTRTRNNIASAVEAYRIEEGD